MCIAIVKPKGISIPEEHLKNGWENNNDGAGFACIDHEGKFLIHKSMTYEGFIDIYRKAVEAYGDTSDFLIHFRITSKGDTTISNCHPFIIDDDRVLIHNGTLYNIYIDKTDKRSDTKVFAEDWLSRLPENWEDNIILHYIVEDFIGASKMCMLHRTKGVILFNPEKGVYDNGIWYSNSTYKKYVSKVTYTDSDYGFYSFKLQRVVSRLEATHMTKEEIESHKEYVSSNCWLKCDNCGEHDSIGNLISVHADHPGHYWCYTCFKDSNICDCCGKRYGTEKIDEYFNPDTKEMMYLCDDCELYMHPSQKEKQLVLKGEA